MAVDPELEAKAVGSKVNSENLVVLSELEDEEIRKLFAPDKFQEWMLFPHEEQKTDRRTGFRKTCCAHGRLRKWQNVCASTSGSIPGAKVHPVSGYSCSH